MTFLLWSGALDSVLLALVVAVFGIALIASGVFPMDAMRAYPPGTPGETPTQVSRRHTWHDWGPIIVGWVWLGLLFLRAAG